MTGLAIRIGKRSAFGIHRLDSRGLSYIEALLAVILLSVALAPILHVLSPPTQASSEEAYFALISARSRMETLQAMDFNAVPVGTTTESVSLGGRTVSRTVTVSLYDLNGDSAPEADVKWIRVTVEAVDLQALKVRY
jgi:Tfp pilus assembly protein PilV